MIGYLENYDEWYHDKYHSRKASTYDELELEEDELELEESLQLELLVKREKLNDLLLKRELLHAGIISPDDSLGMTL